MATIETPYKISSNFGTNYIIVEGKGTPVQNGTELYLARAKALTLSPSATNRITIVIMPGLYDIQSVNGFYTNSDCVDYTSYNGEANVMIYYGSLTSTVAFYLDNEDVNITGIIAGNPAAGGYQKFLVNPNGVLSTTVKNCKAGDNSFSWSQTQDVTNYTTYINCEAGSYSFCSANNYNAINLGQFINCKGIDNCFTSAMGYYTYDAGSYENCKAGTYSFDFPANFEISPTVRFINCEAVSTSFSPIGTMMGYWYNCRLYTSGFATRDAYSIVGCIYYGVDAFGPITICGGGVY